MSAAATHEANRSCRDVLRNRHVAGLLLAAVPISVPRAVKDEVALPLYVRGTFRSGTC